MRKFACLAVVSLFLCFSAKAQEERKTTDVTLSYSYIRAKPAMPHSTGFNMQGGNAEVALNPRGWFRVVGNFGGYHMDRFASSMQTYLLGRAATRRTAIASPLSRKAPSAWPTPP